MQKELPLTNWAYNRPESSRAAIWMINHMRTVVLPGLHPWATPEQIDAAFYSDKEVEGGMVLPTVPLDELLTDGNVRELGAALLNAADRNTRAESPAGTTLNEGLAQLLNQDQHIWEPIARNLGLDVEMLRRAQHSIREQIEAERPGTPVTASDMRAVRHWVAPGAEDSLAEYTRSHVYEPIMGPRRDAHMLRRHLLLHEYALIGKTLSRRELEAFGTLRMLREERLDPGRTLPRDAKGRVDSDALEAQLRAENPALRFIVPLYRYDEHDHDHRTRDAEGNAVVDGVLALYDEGVIDVATAQRLDRPGEYVVELPLRPGAVLQHLGTTDHWFLERAVHQRFPLFAGISGGTARMGRDARLMFGAAPPDVSMDDLALMMLGFVGGHHTFYEELHGLRMAGIPTIPDAAYATPETLYAAMDEYAEQFGYPHDAWRHTYRTTLSPAIASRSADTAPDPRLTHPAGRRAPHSDHPSDGTKPVPAQGVSDTSTSTPPPNPPPATTAENQCAVVLLQDLHAAGISVREPNPTEIGPEGMPMVGDNGLEDRMPHTENGARNEFQEIPLTPGTHSMGEIIDWVNERLHPAARPNARKVAVVVEFAPEDQATATLPNGNHQKVGGHAFLIPAIPLPHNDPRRVVRAFVLAFDDNRPTPLPGAIPRRPVSPDFHVGRPADDNTPGQEPTPPPAIHLDNLLTVRNALATELAHPDPTHAAVAPHELRQPLALLDELVAVQQGAHPVTAERLGLLTDFAHMVDHALLQPPRDALDAASRRLGEIEAQLRAAPTGHRIPAGNTGLLDGVDDEQLSRVWEAATRQMVAAGRATDETTWDDAAANARYWTLTTVVGRLEDFLSFAQTPEALVPQVHLALLKAHFTTTAAWLIANAAAAGTMNPIAAAAVVAFRAAGQDFREPAAQPADTPSTTNQVTPDWDALETNTQRTQTNTAPPHLDGTPTDANVPTTHTDNSPTHTNDPPLHTDNLSTHTDNSPTHTDNPPAHTDDPSTHTSAPPAHREENLGSVAALSDIGLRHDTNEDAYAQAVVEIDGKLVHVQAACDGRSTSTDGARAARVAADGAVADMVTALTAAGATGQFDRIAVARSGLAAAGDQVRALGEQPEYAGLTADEKPDCTIILAIVEEHQVTWDWEGDSRGYKLSLRPGESQRMTEDDSMLTLLMQRLGMPEAQALRHPQAHMISRSLSQPSGGESHAKTTPLSPGDFVLLCTDGMWNDTFEAESLADLLRDSWTRTPDDLLAVLKSFAQRALDNGGHDNITGMLTRPTPPAPTSTPWHRAEAIEPFHHFDQRAAADLAPRDQHRRPFGTRPDIAGIPNGSLAFHHHPDDPNGTDWHAVEPGPTGPREHRAVPTPDLSSVRPLVELLHTRTADRTQLHRELSGLEQNYGAHRFEISYAAYTRELGTAAESFVHRPDLGLRLEGRIVDDQGRKVGSVRQIVFLDPQGRAVVFIDNIYLLEGARGKGFTTSFMTAMEDYYRRSGVHRIELKAVRDGAYFWARWGFRFNDHPTLMKRSADSIREKIRNMMPYSTPDDRLQLRAADRRLRRPATGHPTSADLAELTGDNPRLGRDLLTDTFWFGVKVL
ncbi:GNAT family N-acetyltransferase [Nocardia macrotermitis]|uniref:Uncharacterized protein n=1 Tax=Nocardia macrotermitis TaxID=2585198 RepID=A0A7K0DCX0_9NOCA|nr:GNAT family N-acetyltransferase [Nocardia macrotermitis]MQY23635.1 hypothetical protein [Nocardia macrotermitis]